MLRSIFGDFYGNLTISDILIENKRDDEIVTPVLNVTFIIPENKRNNFSKLMENANFESSLNKTAVNLRKYLDIKLLKLLLLSIYVPLLKPATECSNKSCNKTSCVLKENCDFNSGDDDIIRTRKTTSTSTRVVSTITSPTTQSINPTTTTNSKNLNVFNENLNAALS
ncbi:unnamed protein product [Brachionus calyciflorus]|uniref:Uncharacterized protein n=1 Tax=Brachionus calyciflorus TaxID=104777 RepID=A0A814Q013_9BILA|nr:unnamed protein product [Brachionus calyciflorus]